MGIEPTYPAWKAGVLPLNYTRNDLLPCYIIPSLFFCQVLTAKESLNSKITPNCSKNTGAQSIPLIGLSFRNFQPIMSAVSYVSYLLKLLFFTFSLRRKCAHVINNIHHKRKQHQNHIEQNQDVYNPLRRMVKQ